MDIQVLNEIANPARQASLTQVGASVPANVQLKALKGNPVSVPENPASLTPEESSEQNQDSVTPDISPVARAASDYSAVAGDGLNPDELIAIQDLSGKVRTAVSDFLRLSGLEQAENAADVVASNPEAVQELTSSVEQAVVDALNLPEPEGEFIVSAVPSNEDVFEEVPDLDDFVSIERITKGAASNNEAQVIVANPTLDNSRVNQNVNVENPVTVEKIPESSRGDFRVTPANPEAQNASASENSQVETPVSSEGVANVPQEVPVTSSSPELLSTQTSESAQVKTPPSPSEVAAVSPQQPVTPPETVAANPQEIPVSVVSPITQKAPTGENVQVETPVSRPENVATNQQQVPVTYPGPELQNAEAQNGEIVNPAVITASPESAGNQEATVPSNPQPESNPSQAGPARSNDLFAQERAAVNPENIRDVNELVNSVVDNEFTSEAKKIFSEPKVIRTIADLADFILERIQEILAAKQLRPQSNGLSEVS